MQGVRQFLEAEKSIRLKNLIKFSGINFQDVKEIFSYINTTVNVDNEVEVLAGNITVNWDVSLSVR